MLEVPGANILATPFGELKPINELLSFEDSPTLLHFQDFRGNDIIAYWVDFDKNGNRWLYAKVSKQELFDYLRGVKSLRALFTELDTDFVFLTDTFLEPYLKTSIFPFKLINSYDIP